MFSQILNLKKIRTIIVLVLISLKTCIYANLIDLEEEFGKDFVLETKKIEIPGYPDAFNPSILRWRGSMLMSFRTGGYQDASDYINEHPLLLSFRIRDPHSGSTNGMGLILLDDDFNPISEPQVLDIPHPNPLFMFRHQDPRLVAVGDRVYIVYNNMIEGVNVPEIRRMFIAELHLNENGFYLSQPDCMFRFEGANDQRWQKNWVPFDYNGTLMLAYSINPHRIVQPLLGTDECLNVSSTLGLIDWQWGVLRGGTPALLEGDEYLAFFHSSIEMKTVHSEGKKISHYFMGAYTFSKEPPFNITRISPTPIAGKHFYHGPAHKTWKPLRVVFPCGYIASRDYIWIAYGRQDHEVWIAKLDKKGLLNSLVPVSSAQ